MPTKRVILAILGVALVAIWARNLLMFAPEMLSVVDTSAAPREQGRSANGFNELTDEVISFDDAVRNPFEVPTHIPKSASARKTKEPAPNPAFGLRAAMLGHVFNVARPHAIVYDSTSGRSLICEVGDTLNEHVLARIAANEIVWRSLRGKRLVWKITE